MRLLLFHPHLLCSRPCPYCSPFVSLLFPLPLICPLVRPNVLSPFHVFRSFSRSWRLSLRGQKPVVMNYRKTVSIYGECSKSLAFFCRSFGSLKLTSSHAYT